ncbi:hypothetical protein [Kerstersia similis]|uniref:hypothetical protein n=1 Tax=Kerstersia similis TaxID=206505 RepID=UPI0039F14AFC
MVFDPVAPSHAALQCSNIRQGTDVKVDFADDGIFGSQFLPDFFYLLTLFIRRWAMQLQIKLHRENKTLPPYVVLLSRQAIEIVESLLQQQIRLTKHQSMLPIQPNRNSTCEAPDH